MRRLAPALAVLTIALGACDDPSAIREAPPPRQQFTIFSVLDPSRAVQWVYIEPTTRGGELGQITVELFEDGQSVVRENFHPRTGSRSHFASCDTVYGFVHRTGPVCAEFGYWPRAGSRYRLKVSSPGWSTAVAETRIPNSFQLLDGTLKESTVEATWLPSDGAEAYLVSVENDGCTEPERLNDCRRGWATYTRETRIEEPIPDLDIMTFDAVLVRVAAVDGPLLDYLTGGATGEYFVVPPQENVEGGRGVLGSWVRRWTVDGRKVPVPDQGEWTVFGQDSLGRKLAWVKPHPTDPDLLFARTGGLFRRGHLVRSRNGGRTWQLTLPDSILRSAFAYGRGDTVWAGLNASLIYSIDDGSTWTPVGELGNQIRAIGVASTGAVYAGVSRAAPDDPILFRYDGSGPPEPLSIPAQGPGMYELVDVLETPDGGILALTAVRPVGGGWPDNTLYRSEDGGTTWRGIEDFALVGATPIILKANGLLYTYTNAYSRQRGVYYSTDQGRTWEQALMGRSTAMAVDPDRPERFFLGYDYDFNFNSSYDDTDGGVAVRDSRGQNPTSVGLAGITIYDLWIRDGFLHAATAWGLLRRPLPAPEAAP